MGGAAGYGLGVWGGGGGGGGQRYHLVTTRGSSVMTNYKGRANYHS